VPASKVEVVEVSLPAKTVVHYPNNGANSPLQGARSEMSSGYSQYIVAQTDGLRITQNNPANMKNASGVTTYFLAGDAMHMEPSGAFSFENVLDTACKYLVVIERAH
jgi:hypothetical protein